MDPTKAVADKAQYARMRAKHAELYYHTVANRYSRRDRVGKLLLAAASSSALASVATTWLSEKTITFVGQGLSAVTALVAVWTAVYVDARVIQKAHSVAGQWTQRVAAWEAVELRLAAGETVTTREIADSIGLDAALEAEGSEVPLDKKLLASTRVDVFGKERPDAESSVAHGPVARSGA